MPEPLRLDYVPHRCERAADQQVGTFITGQGQASGHAGFSAAFAKVTAFIFIAQRSTLAAGRWLIQCSEFGEDQPRTGNFRFLDGQKNFLRTRILF